MGLSFCAVTRTARRQADRPLPLSAQADNLQQELPRKECTWPPLGLPRREREDQKEDLAERERRLARCPHQALFRSPELRPHPSPPKAGSSPAALRVPCGCRIQFASAIPDS